MTMSKSTQHIARKRMVIKLGGSMLEGLNEGFFTNIIQLQKNGHDVVLVHGGGPFINKELARNNVLSSVVNGIRVTSKEKAGRDCSIDINRSSESGPRPSIK